MVLPDQEEGAVDAEEAVVVVVEVLVQRVMHQRVITRVMKDKLHHRRWRIPLQKAPPRYLQKSSAYKTKFPFHLFPS